MSKILKIITNPDKRLRQKSIKIKNSEINEKKFQEFCNSLAKTMKKFDGVGLASPQVGVNIRLIAVNTKNGVIIMINPKILKKSIIKEWGEEGCLSVPDTFGKVKRSKNLICTFLDNKGNLKKISAQGLFARVIQHEIDHLDGVLFIDKARDIKKIESNKE
ncbi:MAG: peptide deformylase [Patescibacteria group bacterium]